MSARLSITFFYIFSALTLLAAATPAPWAVPPPVTTTFTVHAPNPTVTETPSQCNTGPVQCCQNTMTAGSTSGATLLGLLGILISDLNVLIGADCSPISVIGVGGNTCQAEPVCCEDNSRGSVISIGCIPVSL